MAIDTIEVLYILKSFFVWLWEFIKHPFFLSLITYFVFDAIVRYRRVVGEVDSKLLFYQNIITSLGSINTDIASAKKLECSRELRKLAGDLGAAYNAVFIKWFFSFIRVILYEKENQEVVKELGALSNSVFDKDDGKSDSIKKIREILKIPQRWKSL